MATLPPLQAPLGDEQENAGIDVLAVGADERRMSGIMDTFLSLEDLGTRWLLCGVVWLLCGKVVVVVWCSVVVVWCGCCVVWCGCCVVRWWLLCGVVWLLCGVVVVWYGVVVV